MVLNKHLEKPFNKVPPEGNHLDTLQPAEIRAKLSSKVTQILNRREQSRERRSEKTQRLNLSNQIEKPDKARPKSVSKQPNDDEIDQQYLNPSKVHFAPTSDDDRAENTSASATGEMSITLLPNQSTGQAHQISCTCGCQSPADLEANLIKQRTENDVLKITVGHLKNEINSKQGIIRRQNQELE
jgi:hypothetical protein